MPMLKCTNEMEPGKTTIIRQTEGTRNSFVPVQTAQEIARFHIQSGKFEDKLTISSRCLVQSTFI
jgi:hypothetical protein